MSGPLEVHDVPTDVPADLRSTDVRSTDVRSTDLRSHASPGAEEPASSSPAVEVTESRLAQVGSFSVRRALPRKSRRTVGAWCFADHLGPADVTPERSADIGPHPHMGLQTVTWLLSGELVHQDSLGSEQVIRPGQLNLMTAGRGVAHAEEGTGTYRGQLHGIQLWVAQPGPTRHGDAAFEHHAELPRLALPGATATVLVGELAGVTSPARRDTEHLGVDLDLHGPTTVLPLRADHEYAFVVLEGAIEVEGSLVEPGHLAYLGTGTQECAVSASAPARALLLGGAPFPEQVLMWWNFVGRDRQEMVDAYRHWRDDDGWFGHVSSKLARIPVDPPPWMG